MARFRASSYAAPPPVPRGGGPTVPAVSIASARRPAAVGIAALLVWGHVAVSRNDLAAQIGLIVACAAVLAAEYRFRKSPSSPLRFVAAVAGVVLATLASATLLGGFAATPRRASPWRIAALCGLMLLTCFGYALSGPVGRVSAIFVADQRFVDDATPFQTSEWALKEHVGWMRGLSSSGQQYPPGNMLASGYLGVVGRNLVVAFVASSPVWVYLAGRARSLSRRARWQAALLVACCGYLLSTPTISVTAEVMPLAATCLWLAGRGVGVRGRPAWWAPPVLAGLARFARDPPPHRAAAVGLPDTRRRGLFRRRRGRLLRADGLRPARLLPRGDDAAALRVRRRGGRDEVDD